MQRSPLEMLLMRSLRARSGRWSPALDALAGELRAAIEGLGYSTAPPLILANTAYASVRLRFSSHGWSGDLLLQVQEVEGMIWRHVTGFARHLYSDPWSVFRELDITEQGPVSLPVVEATVLPTWPCLAAPVRLRAPSGRVVGVVFDRVAGRTSRGGQRRLCRVAILRGWATWALLLAAIPKIIPAAVREGLPGHENLFNVASRDS